MDSGSISDLSERSIMEPIVDVNEYELLMMHAAQKWQRIAATMIIKKTTDTVVVSL